MFISTAYAQAAGAQQGGFDFLIPLVLIGLVMYFLMIRPQQKKAKMHREMLSKLRRGDKVLTSGGIMGVVSKAPQEGEIEIEVEIAHDVKIKLVRQAIAEVLTKPEPVAGGKAADGKTEEAKPQGGLLGRLFGGKKE